MDGLVVHRSVLVGDSLGAEALGKELGRAGRSVRQLAKACLERSTSCLGGDLPEGMFRLLLEPDGAPVRLTDGLGIAIVGNNMPPEGCPPPRGRARKKDQWRFQRVATSWFENWRSSPAVTTHDVYGNRNTLFFNNLSPAEFSRTKQKVRHCIEAISHPGNLARPVRECDNPFLPKAFITEVYKNKTIDRSGEYLFELSTKTARITVDGNKVVEKVLTGETGFRISYAKPCASEQSRDESN